MLSEPDVYQEPSTVWKAVLEKEVPISFFSLILAIPTHPLKKKQLKIKAEALFQVITSQNIASKLIYQTLFYAG